MEQSDVDLLHTVPPYHLQAMLKLRRHREQGASALAISSGDSIGGAAQQLFHPPAITEAISSLSDTEGLILGELVACGGRANSRDLALYLTSSQAAVFNRGAEPTPAEHGGMLYPAPHPHGVFEQSLRRLLMLGLLFWGKQTNFAGRDYTSGVYDGVLIVPQAVKDVVGAGTRREQQAHSATALSTALGDGMRASQRMLYLYWSHVSTLREGLPLNSNGLLARTPLRQVNDLFGAKGGFEQLRTEQDAPRLLFIRLLLMRLGLLHERQGALYAASPDEFFAKPLLERMRLCYREWLETPFWNELSFLPDVLVRPGPQPLEAAHEEIVRARHKVMERLAAAGGDAWCEIPAFIARTKLYAPYLLFPRQYGARADRYSQGSNPYGWDFRLRRGWLTHREGWHMVEGGFIRAVVLGPLHWLGLLDVRGEKGISAFRPAAGMAVVTSSVAGSVEEPAWGRLVVQPNFELVALAPVSETLLIKLDSFAERIGLEHIAQYKVTKASVTRAIQMGLHVDAIQQILTQAAGESGGGEIPQNVHYSLVEWERQARKIELWQDSVLLEVDETQLLDALFADSATRPLLRRRLSPVLAEVRPEHLARIQAILWQRDYLPAQTVAPTQATLLAPDHGEGGDREPQWRLHADGSLQPLYAVSDLFLGAELERVSDLDTLTGWRKITPASIERATGRGLQLDAIIHFFQRYCEGGIPPSMLIRLKLWGRGYDDGEEGESAILIEHSPLLHLSEQVLADIQTDEEILQLLDGEVPRYGRLARVAPEKLEQLTALLRERGFEVE